MAPTSHSPHWNLLKQLRNTKSTRSSTIKVQPQEGSTSFIGKAIQMPRPLTFYMSRDSTLPSLFFPLLSSMLFSPLSFFCFWKVNNWLSMQITPFPLASPKPRELQPPFCYDRYFFSTDLALFLECILSYHKVHYLFIYFLTRSLSPLCYHSLYLISVLCMAILSSLLFHSDASCITHVHASILCTAYLISTPTAQGLGFSLCIQYQ